MVRINRPHHLQRALFPHRPASVPHPRLRTSTLPLSGCSRPCCLHRRRFSASAARFASTAGSPLPSCPESLASLAQSSHVGGGVDIQLPARAARPTPHPRAGLALPGRRSTPAKLQRYFVENRPALHSVRHSAMQSPPERAVPSSPLPSLTRCSAVTAGMSQVSTTTPSTSPAAAMPMRSDDPIPSAHPACSMTTAPSSRHCSRTRLASAPRTTNTGWHPASRAVRTARSSSGSPESFTTCFGDPRRLDDPAGQNHRRYPSHCTFSAHCVCTYRLVSPYSASSAPTPAASSLRELGSLPWQNACTSATIASAMLSGPSPPRSSPTGPLHSPAARLKLQAKLGRGLRQQQRRPLASTQNSHIARRGVSHLQQREQGNPGPARSCASSAPPRPPQSSQATRRTPLAWSASARRRPEETVQPLPSAAARPPPEYSTQAAH